MSQVERIAYIDRTLRDVGHLSCAEAARRFEVTPRQVKRDIEYLRDRLDAPIVYDRKSRDYHYAQPYTALRFADERLLIFYVLVKSIALNQDYMPVVTRELLQSVEEMVSPDYREVSERISYTIPVAESMADMEDFTTICQAMVGRKRLDIEYENARGERNDRSVEPERLVNYAGRWYLIGHDHLRNSLRTFHLSRMRRLALSHEDCTFTDDPEHLAAVETYVASGFGIFNGREISRTTVRIHGQAAALVARQQWHPDQVVVEGCAPDGSLYIDLTLPVSDWRELLGRVLSFGSLAEAVAPAEFRKLWQEEVQKMGERAKG